MSVAEHQWLLAAGSREIRSEEGFHIYTQKYQSFGDPSQMRFNNSNNKNTGTEYIPPNYTILPAPPSWEAFTGFLDEGAPCMSNKPPNGSSVQLDKSRGQHQRPKTSSSSAAPRRGNQTVAKNGPILRAQTKPNVLKSASVSSNFG
jgi:hypothetical protein